jgi:hypothetical protein
MFVTVFAHYEDPHELIPLFFPCRLCMPTWWMSMQGRKLRIPDAYFPDVGFTDSFGSLSGEGRTEDANATLTFMGLTSRNQAYYGICLMYSLEVGSDAVQ